MPNSRKPSGLRKYGSYWSPTARYTSAGSLSCDFRKEYALERIESGYLDTTFFRDDFRRTQKILAASPTDLNFQIEGKSVVLIDDVLFTGRSIRAALTAIDSYGRPSNIELLTLIDRRFSRHLPIQPDYLGVQIDALEGDKVRVKWGDRPADSMVYLENKDA